MRTVPDIRRFMGAVLHAAALSLQILDQAICVVGALLFLPRLSKENASGSAKLMAA